MTKTTASSLALSAEPIEMFDPDNAWPAAYERERPIVAAAFPKPPLLIEHMGSTAVPGLAAKPIIDIIVLVRDLDDGRAAIPALESQGYSYWAANPDTTKLYLVKGLPPAPRRTHHLHIYTSPEEVERHLMFRDHLRANIEARDAYQALKHDLATRFRNDREAYSYGKDAFVDEVIARLGGPKRG